LGQRRRAGDEEAEPAAEAIADLGEDQLVGDGRLDGEQAPRLLAALAQPRDLGADADRPAKDLELEAAGVTHLADDLVVDLLEDARRRRHEGGADDGEVLDQSRYAAVDRRRETQLQLRDLEDLAERVRQRQPQVLEIAVLDDA